MKNTRILAGTLLCALSVFSCQGGVEEPPIPWIVGSWVADAYYYYLPSQQLTVLNADGIIQTFFNYDGSDPGDSGTWSLDGNVLTANMQLQGNMVLTFTKFSDDLCSFDSEGGTRTQYLYRKGTQPGVSVFDYATAATLSAGVSTDGTIPAPPGPPPSKMKVHQVVLYAFTAPAAGTYTVQLQDQTNSSYTAAAGVSASKADKQTVFFGSVRASNTPFQVTLGSGELIYLIVEGPYVNPGETFNILVAADG